MDSRGTAVKSGHGGTNVSESVVKWMLYLLLPSSFAHPRDGGTLRIRRDCRKFFDKFPRPKSRRSVHPLKIHYSVISSRVLLSRPLMWVLMPCRYLRDDSSWCSDGDVVVECASSSLFRKAQRCIMQHNVKAVPCTKVHAHYYKLFTLVCAARM